MITPLPGWQLDPKNPNGVIPIPGYTPQSTATPSPGSTAGTLVKDPSSGAYTLAPGSDMSPVPSSSLGSLGLPSNTSGSPTPNAMGTGTAPPTDPKGQLSSFVTQLQTMLQTAQKGAFSPALSKQSENLENQALNLSNPLNGNNLNGSTPSPYSQLFSGMTPEASLAAQNGTQDAFAPGQLSIQDQEKSLAATAGASADSIKSILSQFGPQVVGYGGAVVNPLTGETVSTNNPASDPLISQAIQQQRLTPDMITRYGSGAILATLQQDPGYNFITNQASAKGQVAAAVSGNTYKYNPITGLGGQISGGTGVLPASTGAPSSGGGALPPHANPSVLALQKLLVGANFMTQKQMDSGPGIFGPQTTASLAAYEKAGNTLPSGLYNPTSTSSGGGAAPSVSPSGLPHPDASQGKAIYDEQNTYNNKVLSGTIGDQIVAQNTAISHLLEAFTIGSQLQNASLQGANGIKNWYSSQTGQAAVGNYQTAHQLSSAELSKAYGTDTGAERSLTASIGDANSSPSQILGYAQTAAQLLSSKILANINQFRSVYPGQPVPMSTFISPESQQAMAKIGIIFKVSGADVGVYKLGAGGTATKLY